MEGQRKQQSEGLFAYFPKISKESETVVDSSLSGADVASKGSIQSCPDEKLIDSKQSFSDAEQGTPDSGNEHELHAHFLVDIRILNCCTLKRVISFMMKEMTLFNVQQVSIRMSTTKFLFCRCTFVTIATSSGNCVR